MVTGIAPPPFGDPDLKTYTNCFEEGNTDLLYLENAEVIDWNQGGNQKVLKISPGGKVIIGNTFYSVTAGDEARYMVSSKLYATGQEGAKITVITYRGTPDQVAVQSEWSLRPDDWLELQNLDDSSMLTGKFICSNTTASPDSVTTGSYEGNADTLEIQNTGSVDVYIDCIHVGFDNAI